MFGRHVASDTLISGAYKSEYAKPGELEIVSKRVSAIPSLPHSSQLAICISVRSAPSFMDPSTEALRSEPVSVEPRFTGFYRVLLGFTGFYRVLPGFTGFYWVLLGFTGF